jgi:hypothetical protein
MKLSIFLIFSLGFITSCLGQQTITSAIDRQFNNIERHILTTAEAMPEDKINFTPESLHIQNSDFKGARTFAS